MAEFINTIDVLGDDAVVDGIINRSITEFKDDTIKDVGAYAFHRCTKLEYVSLPNAVNIKSDSFSECSSLRSANLPAVKVLGSWDIRNTFRNCTALESVNIPAAKGIEYYTFENCALLEEIDLPEVTVISGWAFQYCSKLARITCPKVESITNSFRGCAFKVIDLPSIKTMSSPFAFNYAIKHILLRNASTVCTLKDYLDSNHENTVNYIKTVNIYVPAALMEDYKSATNWSQYADQFRALEDYTVDGTITGALDETKI